MVTKRNKKKAGWFGESRRHSEASTKGWDNRFGKNKVSLSDVKKIHAKRSNRARIVDNMNNSKIVGKNRYAQWVGNPARFDVEGIDTKKFKGVLVGRNPDGSPIYKSETLRKPSFGGFDGVSVVVPKTKELSKNFIKLVKKDSFEPKLRDDITLRKYSSEELKNKTIDTKVFLKLFKEAFREEGNLVKITFEPKKGLKLESRDTFKYYKPTKQTKSSTFFKDYLKQMVRLVSGTKPKDVKLYVGLNEPLYLETKDFAYYTAPRVEK